MIPILIKDAVENLCHRLLTGYPKTPVIPHAAVQAFRNAQWSTDAIPIVELISGTPIWTDEAWEDFLGSGFGQSSRYQDPFLYRLYLITGEMTEGVDYGRCRETWDYLRARAPSWPGFREDRCSPEINERILSLISDAYAAL